MCRFRNPSSIAVLLAVSLIAVAAHDASAALPITAIREYQKNAPNHVELQVTKVTYKKDASPDHQLVVMHAKVVKVMRTKDNIKAGDELVITWSMPRPDVDFAGDWASPPDKDSKVQAFLKKEGKQFKPAAYSGSFEDVKTDG